MNQEQRSDPLSTEQVGGGAVSDGEASDQPEIDFYEVAEFIFMSRVEQLQQQGEMSRPSQITTEEELDDHFDDLSRLYRQVCWEMDLAWPPPPIDDDLDGLSA